MMDWRTTHGRSRTTEHKLWTNLKTRCRNPRSKTFANYGGRGILLCQRWEKFENFFADMGERPSPEHSIERIDTNGNYELDNCRWATRLEQANNKRNNHRLTFQGQTMTIAQWARQTGLSEDAIERRINLLGWSTDKALATPPRGWGPGRPRITT